MLGKDEMEESGGSMEMEPASHLPPELAAAVRHHMWTAAPAIWSARVGIEEMIRSLMKKIGRASCRERVSDQV